MENNNININQKNRYRERMKDRYHKETEDCCLKPNIIERSGVRVCTNCGIVLGKQIIGYERRAFSFEEINNRKITEKKWRDMGPRTFIGRKNIDSHGQQLVAKEKTKYNRLDKIQNSLISSLERNMWEARPKLDLLASKLNLPLFVKETAWRIYIQSARKKLTMGRSIIAFIAASMYAAIRIHEIPKMFDEVCDSEMVQKRSAHQALGLLIKEILPILNLSYKPITARQLVYRYGNDFDLPMKIKTLAVCILTKAFRNGMNHVGKDPRGIAASAIYIAALEFNEGKFKKTQSQIASIANITEVTLRSRIRDLKNNVKQCLDLLE